MSKHNKKSPITDENNINIETDPELEERIMREADNDFYDEKSPDNKQSIYRSKALKQWEDEKSANKTFTKSVAQEQPRKLSHAEKAGIVISVVMLVYALANLDKPLIFMALSLLTHFIKPAVGAMFGEHNQEVQNALRTFSFVLAFGAVLFLFMG